MTESTSKTSPFVIAAAIAVIITSIVAVGSMTGLIPSNTSKTEAPAATTPAQTAAMTPAPPAGSMEKPVAAAAEKAPAAQSESVAKPAKKHTAKTAASKQSQPVTAEAGKTEKQTPVNLCANCGTIAAIRTIEQAGEGSGLGAIAGGVVGGLLGNQVGAGTGKDLATIAGAVGGGYAGHQIEKKVKTTKHYEISVRMDDGSYRTFMQETEPNYAVGEKVKIIDGVLTRN